MLSLAIIAGYAFFPKSSGEGPIIPLSYLAIFLYFGFVGFIETKKSHKLLTGFEAGAITGVVTMVVVAVTFFLVHNVFFYNQTILEPEKIEGLLRSGLPTIRAYLLFNNIRSGLFGIILGGISGVLFGGFGGVIAWKKNIAHSRYNKDMFSVIRTWIPFAIVITLMCGLVYGSVQQAFRQGTNDPQIQMSEDIARQLDSGEDAIDAITSFTPPVNIALSLAPYVIIYNDVGEPISSTGMLDGKMPQVPRGVLEYARAHGQDRLTWQPKPDVRSAIVVTRVAGRNAGFVLVGRSLREVEHREDQLFLRVGFAWGLTLMSTFFAIAVLKKLKHSKI